MKALSRRTCLLASLFALCAFAQNSLPAPPDTPKRPVVDEYQGTSVRDDYRWLENWDDPAVKQWSAAQNARTRQYLDQLPSRAAIRGRLKELTAQSSPSYYDVQFRAGTLFAMKSDPKRQHAVLATLRSADDPASERVIFDPSSAPGNLAVDYYVPSFGAKYVALAVSQNGSEDSFGRVIDVASGKELTDVVPRVNFATGGGSIAWKADSSGFYYTRYPQGNERPPEDANFYQQIYFHKLGTDAAQDVYVLGKDFPRIAEVRLQTSDDGRWLLASVANGDGGQFAHYVMDSDGGWADVTHFEDAVVSVKFGPSERGSGNALYLLSRKSAPRGQILRMPLKSLTLKEPPFDLAHAEVVVPQSSGGPEESDRASIEDFLPTWGHLYVLDIIGGPSRLRVFDGKGQALPAPGLPPVSAVDSLVNLGGGDALLHIATYLQPPAWYQVDASSGKSKRTALVETSPVNYDDAEVVREFATSKDGTRVPVNIIRRKGTRLDDANPTILTAYGGYDISTKPGFLGEEWRPWLDQGGIFAEANIRGGGEYGEDWHAAGKLTHKQNVFDDFIASAQYLIDKHYSSPEHLAIIGGSNGGLLMGAAFTQRPDLFRAVVSYVGIYDMLRVEIDPNGQFNTTEFGTVKDQEQFKALYGYSPYRHVKDGTAYPAILMPTGENDHRVNPMQSRKMIARLQAADRSGHPILLRTSSTAGHGFGTALDERIEEEADVYSFLFDQLGMRYGPANH
ncbi:MAG TPA: prolyl oligopeptidase family serine peptidase [Candidatus Sulfotelmatobacter sp.]|nr:prolyl oligopeptidase family serine peptidase [Candidatus Sulfotelmatobacter sp.]